ncbi:MAG: hypothetical protein L3J56_10200 [Bacteroidales bacterium]|nr:hypothetical protein [Bacteroidales bacterium]
MVKSKKHIWILVLITLIFSESLVSGIKADTIPSVNLATISQVNQGNSYITFPTDIGNIEPLWFEANLIPNFHIRTNKDSRLMGVLTPQIMIRMYREYSFPVKTPSYRPQVTMYYKLCKERKNSTVFLRLAHHSNGQSDDFYSENGKINLESGDFSTNYVEIGLIRTFFNEKLNATQFFRTSFRKDFFEESNELNGIYSKFRWKNSFSVFKIRQKETKNLKKKAGFSLKADAELMFGDIYTWSNKNTDRLNIGLTAFYTPKFFEDIGFFINFYHGQDYYNIYFNHQINVIRFGIMTELLRF